jgi:hypothetical protein
MEAAMRIDYTDNLEGGALIIERHALITWGAVLLLGAVLAAVGLLHWGTWVGEQDARMQALYERQQAVQRCQRDGYAAAQVTMPSADPRRDIIGCVRGSDQLLGRASKEGSGHAR